MRKQWSILLALVLVLTACGTKAPVETAESSEPAVAATSEEAKALPGEPATKNPIQLTKEEKEAGWEIYPNIGLKLFFDKALWEKEDAYVFAELIGDREDHENPIYSGIYYRLCSPHQNEMLNDLYTRKEEITQAEFATEEDKLVGEMPGLFAVVTVRAQASDEEVMEKLGYDAKEVLFEDAEVRTLYLTAEKDDEKAVQGTHPELSSGLAEDEEIVLDRYHRLLEDVEKNVRPSMVTVRPLTLAEMLAGIDFKNLAVTDLDGNKTTLGTLMGDNTVTMVNVWATFCPPCKAELADVAKAHEAMAKDGAGVIGILGDVRTADDETYGTAKELLEKAHATYPNVLRTEAVDEIIDLLEGYPTTFYLNRDGKIIGPSFVGERELDDFTTTAKDLIGK